MDMVAPAVPSCLSLPHRGGDPYISKITTVYINCKSVGVS